MNISLGSIRGCHYRLVHKFASDYLNIRLVYHFLNALRQNTFAMQTPELQQVIINIFRKHGSIVYGEECSVLSHSVQSGLIARDRGFDEELILGAFLHDIGHLCPLEQEEGDFERMGEYGIDAHDKLGGDYLKSRGFSDRIIAVVKNHVPSKRYLCLKDQTYYDQLSEASKQTLEYQGGMMSEEEAAEFEADPFFEDSIQIRQVDEAAKEQNFEVQEKHWAYFQELLKKVL